MGSGSPRSARRNVASGAPMRSRWCASRVTTTASRPSCPAASVNAWPWRGQSSTGRASCSSTNRSGALDLKLREQLQIELKQIQREVGITFVYVTHDQEEALTMSDRIAVFNEGRIEQVGEPEGVYERPANAFVAGFVGVSNLIHRNGGSFHGPTREGSADRRRGADRGTCRRGGDDRRCLLRGHGHEVPRRAGRRRPPPGRAAEPRADFTRGRGHEGTAGQGWLAS